MERPDAETPFWRAEAAHTLPPLMDAELKRQIADDGLTFTVHSIREAKTTFGPTWMLEIELGGERWTLPLSKTAHRDGQLRRMQDHLAGGGPIACALAVFEGKNGRGWNLVRPKDATTA